MGDTRSHYDNGSAFNALRAKFSQEWRHIVMAAEAANVKRKTVGDALHPKGRPFFSSDASVVVFGSLARDEFTIGSDLDWTLLVDGQADSQHLRTAQEIESIFNSNGIKPPGHRNIRRRCL